MFGSADVPRGARGAAFVRIGMETIPEFEYHPAKSQANLEKHGIDFETAQALWLDGRKALGPTVSPDEARWMLVAMLDGKLWSAVSPIATVG